MTTKILDKIPYEKIWVIPPWQRWLAVFGVIFLFFAIYYFVSFKSTTEEIGKLQAESQKLQAEYKKYHKYTKKMPELEIEINQLNKLLEKAKAQLPSAKEIPELLTTISNIGTNQGLEFLLFKPMQEAPVDFYAEVPVQMVILGNYHDVAIFFDKVKKLPRIVDISKISITSNKSEGKTTQRTTCTAVTYKYLEKQALIVKPKGK